jgi:unsaturated rhamnogalacturonyl hydrolase
VTEVELLGLAADRLRAYPFEVWHYGDSIGFEGLLAASELLGDGRYAAFAHGVFVAWAARRRPFRPLDNTAPGHAICVVAERTGDDRVLDAARELADHLRSRPLAGGAYRTFERAPLREPYGGETLSTHDLELLADPGAGVFLDCLHFDPPFFAHLGTLTHDSSLVDLAAAQALAYVDLLQDTNGLFWHFWLERTGSRHGHGWGRGQGWALLGLLDTLAYLPGGHAARPRLTRAFRALASALVARQREDGSWPTVVTLADAPPEASTSAFVAAGFAAGVERGLLDASYADAAERAWRDAMRRVDGTGALTEVSAAVWASTVESHYLHVPVGFVVPWGQGPLLLAARRLTR